VCLLTIVGGVREAWSDWGRGARERWWARGPCPAWSCGPSTSPLDRQPERMRKIPTPLWNEVLDVVNNIKRCIDEGDSKMEAVYTALLEAIYARQEVLGAPDPALTEAVADYTDDAEVAVRLYRLSLAQSSRNPGEPTHTKRIDMASRLIELGDLQSARTELIQGRAEAERLSDTLYVDFADELLAKLAV
jgi:hypothetical protein